MVKDWFEGPKKNSNVGYDSDDEDWDDDEDSDDDEDWDDDEDYEDFDD